MRLKSICVFAGSSSGVRGEYRRATVLLARALVERDCRVVYGGAHVGLMGALADTCLQDGGEVIGVIPEFLADKEVAHRGLPDLRIVQSMHERKQLMSDLAEGFIGLPGGLGTLEEFFEIFTWAQLGMHQKPFGLLNVCGFYDPLAEFLDHAVSERFVNTEHREMLTVEEDPHTLLDRLDDYSAPQVEKWIDPNTS